MNPSHEHAHGLLKRAMDDQYVFAKLANDPKAPSWSLGFHAEQAVEKAIKAVLAIKSVEYPRTHNITMLLGLLEKNGISLPKDSKNLHELTPFGVAFRYDDTVEEEVNLDRETITKCIKRTIEWAKTMIDS